MKNIRRLISKMFVMLLAKHYGTNLNIRMSLRCDKFDLYKLVEEAETNAHKLLEQLRVSPDNPYGDDVEALAGHIVADFEKYEVFK